MITLTTIGHKQRRNRNYRRVWPVAPTSGIGTTAPQFPVHVFGVTSGEVRAEGATYAKFSLRTSSSGTDQKAWQFYASQPDNRLVLSALNDTETVDTVAMYVNRGTGTAVSSVTFPNGNVGINSTTPAAKLDVAGGVKLGNDTGSCTSINAGTFKYDGTYTYVCRANAWYRLSDESTSASTFSCTGSDQTYTVPTGVTSVTIKMWGAGGGGGSKYGWNMGYPGGGGGFTKGTLSVTAGQVLTVIAGCGGAPGNATLNVVGAYGGGGRGCPNNVDCGYGGGGGGRSAIRNSGGTELMTAGGGGGGGSSRTWTYSQEGGAGGGSYGQNGAQGEVTYGKGMGGTPYFGGNGGQAAAAGVAGSQYQGGYPGTNSYGGGGGGGWYGGGGGSYQESNTMGGGGGGSGYIGGAGVSNATMIGGWGTTPAESTNYHYSTGVGLGGQGHTSPTAGGSGRVVVIPN